MITKQDVNAAQTSWANAVVDVGGATSPAEAHARAVRLVETLYQVEDGSLLFSPTKAAVHPFRRTLEEAVSYFIGQGPFPDAGFALEPWTSVRFDNVDIVCRGDVAIAMGHYFFGRADGSEFQAEYSFVYVRDSQNHLRIQLHHSAVPYRG